MTAKELYELTKPLFDKHPSTNPKNLVFASGSGVWYHQYDEWLSASFAALIIQGHLFEWLCRKGNAKTVTCVNERWYVHDWRSSGRGATMLHALVESAMEVPVC